jgi:hypothetical protein
VRDHLADAACAATNSADGNGGRCDLSHLRKSGRADGKRTTNAAPRPQRPELAVAAYRRIAYDYGVGNELYRLMLYETKSEAGFRTRWLRDAQLVLA